MVFKHPAIIDTLSFRAMSSYFVSNDMAPSTGNHMVGRGRFAMVQYKPIIFILRAVKVGLKTKSQQTSIIDQLFRVIDMKLSMDF